MSSLIIKIISSYIHISIQAESDMMIKSSMSLVTEQPFSSSFVSDILDLGFIEKLNVDDLNMSLDDVIKDSINTLSETYTTSLELYRSIVNNLVAKFPIPKTTKYQSKNLTNFNWFLNTPLEYCYKIRKSTEYSDSRSLNHNKKLILKSLDMLEYLVAAFMHRAFPKMVIANNTESLFNQFFDMIYTKTLESSIIFCRESGIASNNKFRMKSIDTFAYYNKHLKYFQEAHRGPVYKSRKGKFEEFYLQFKKIRFRYLNLIATSRLAPDPWLATVEKYYLKIHRILKDCGPEYVSGLKASDSGKTDQDICALLEILIGFCIELIGLNHPNSFDILKRTLPCTNNIKFVLIVKKHVEAFNEVNIFDFNYYNFRFYFIIQLCYAIKESVEDADIHRKGKYSQHENQAKQSYFKDVFRLISNPEIRHFIFCDQTYYFCDAFLRKNYDKAALKNLNLKIDEILSEEGIKEMEMFGIISLLKQDPFHIPVISPSIMDLEDPDYYEKVYIPTL